MEDTAHVIFLIELLITLLNREVREGKKKMAEVYDIVPDDYVIRCFLPPEKLGFVIERTACLAIGICRRLISGHCAKLYNDIRLSLYVIDRRVNGIKISKG